MNNDSHCRHSIEFMLNTINTILARTSTTLHEAHACILRNEQNLAIGTAVCAERDLEAALILYRAVLAVHRINREEAPCR